MRCSRRSSATRGETCSRRSAGSRRRTRSRASSCGHVAAILLRSWRRDPDLVRVLVREIARSPQVQSEGRRARTGVHDDRAVGSPMGSGRCIFRVDLDARACTRGSSTRRIKEILTAQLLGSAPRQRPEHRAPRAAGGLRHHEQDLPCDEGDLVRNLGSARSASFLQHDHRGVLRDPRAIHRPGILIGLVLGAGGLRALCISPVISPGATRSRRRWGRRPFMLAALGPLGFCLLLMPFMPNLWTASPDRVAFFLRTTCTASVPWPVPRPRTDGHLGRAQGVQHIFEGAALLSRSSAAGFCSRSGAGPVRRRRGGRPPLVGQSLLPRSHRAGCAERIFEGARHVPKDG